MVKLIPRADGDGLLLDLELSTWQSEEGFVM